MDAVSSSWTPRTPGGESWRQATDRVGRFLQDLRLRWSDFRILVVGHVATRWGASHLSYRAILPAEWGGRKRGIGMLKRDICGNIWGRLSGWPESSLKPKTPQWPALVAALVLAGCSSGASPRASNTTTGPAPAAAASSGTVWLCRPGQSPDPCAGDLTATTVVAGGATAVQQPVLSLSASRFDCFYVYPTTSQETTTNADLTVQAAETGAARQQASRFSSVCRVWAPMYRQVTLRGLADGAAVQPGPIAVAYDSLLSAWRNYLAHDNDGRGVVFIGHSQGAAMLIRLLAAEIDPAPSLRARMVAAILAGGNPVVPVDGSVGATFAHLPLCTAAEQAGCVIAYSSFLTEPPADALFGRPGLGVSLQSGQLTKTGVQVDCVNPAGLGSGAGSLQPYLFGASPGTSTPWVTYPGLYQAQCEYRDGASWLQVTPTRAAGDTRPVVTETLGPRWGLHLEDINLALGNLVTDVAALEENWSSHHR